MEKDEKTFIDVETCIIIAIASLVLWFLFK